MISLRVGERHDLDIGLFAVFFFAHRHQHGFDFNLRLTLIDLIQSRRLSPR